MLLRKIFKSFKEKFSKKRRVKYAKDIVKENLERKLQRKFFGMWRTAYEENRENRDIEISLGMYFVQKKKEKIFDFFKQMIKNKKQTGGENLKNKVNYIFDLIQVLYLIKSFENFLKKKYFNKLKLTQEKPIIQEENEFLSERVRAKIKLLTLG